MLLSDGRFSADLSAAERIRSSTRQEGECWIWLKSLSADGRPKMTLRGKRGMAGRFSYEAFVGTVPPRFVVRSTCGTRGCVAPQHLEAVSAGVVAGEREKRVDDARERFEGRYLISDSGCWEWRGARTTDGYGTFSIHSKTVYAHRYSYEIHMGDIPDGLVLDHLCRVRHCVNPGHLEAVTNAENVRRGDATKYRSFPYRL